MRRRRVFLGLLAAIVLIAACAAAAWWTFFRPSLHGPSTADPASTNASSAGAESSEQQRRRGLLLGVWEDDYQGHRTMTLRDDQTGTMVVELSGMKAALFAQRLRFDMQWSLGGDRLRKRTTGGEPADKIALVLKMMGDTAEDTLVELDEQKLVLRDADGKTVYHWRRVR
jgi:hypothetical protein